MKRRNFLVGLLVILTVLSIKVISDKIRLKSIEYKQGDGELIEIPVKFKPSKSDSNKDYFSLT